MTIRLILLNHWLQVIVARNRVKRWSKVESTDQGEERKLIGK